MEKVAIVGSGVVGKTLAQGFKKHGYEVIMGSRDGQPVEGFDGEFGKFEEVVKDAKIVVLAVKGSAAEEVVSSLKDNLSGKVVIDTTNPIAQEPPENGVLRFFTSLDNSLMERLQKKAPGAYFVKAFNSVGNAVMVNPDFGGETPSMFICGNSEEAKKEVGQILEKFGWEVEDMGMVESARAIEPLCILWCIPGMLKNEWLHAFKHLKK